MYYRVFFQVSLANEFLRETTDAKLSSRGASAALVADRCTSTGPRRASSARSATGTGSTSSATSRW
jgi:hypothetical protein